MVPTFGSSDFAPSKKAYVSAEDQERAGYLSEVTLNSTEFGVGSGVKRFFASLIENVPPMMLP